MYLGNPLDDLIDEGVGEVLLDLLPELPVRRRMGNAGSVGCTSTSGYHPEDTAVLVKDDRGRVAGGGKRTIRIAVGEHGDLHRRPLDTTLIIDAGERLHPVDPTGGGVRRQTVLDDEKATFSVRIKMLGVVGLIGLDDAERPNKTVLRILVDRPVLWPRKHELVIIQRREVASDINFTTRKCIPVELVIVGLD